MKNLTFTLLLLSVAMSGFAQQQRVTLSVEKQALHSVLEEIERQTGLTFAYSGSVIDPEKVVSVTVADKAVADVLNTLFNDAAVTVTFKGSQIVISAPYPPCVIH